MSSIAAISLRRLHARLLMWGNLAAVILGCCYLIWPSQNMAWNMYGLLVAILLIANPLLAPPSNEHRHSDMGFLCLNMLVMVLIPAGLTNASLTVHNIHSRSHLAHIALLVLLALAAKRAFVYYKNMPSALSGTLQPAKSASRWRVWFKIPVLLVLILLLSGGYFVAQMFLTRKMYAVAEVFVVAYSFYYAVFYLALTLLIIRMNNGPRRLWLNIPISIAGAALFFICLLPTLTIPKLLGNAASSYEAAFGPFKPAKPGLPAFRPMPFSFSEYFFGSPNGEYQVRRDIVYYEGKSGKDVRTRLSFDAYLPPKNLPAPPKGYPVLIRIHGGGWIIGDKGLGNFAQENKYFAAQGYAVFDIQYGLAKCTLRVKDLPGLSNTAIEQTANDILMQMTSMNHWLVDRASHFGLNLAAMKSFPCPPGVQGDFNIDDMLRHIGAFTTFLANHATDYRANLDVVFISVARPGDTLFAPLASVWREQTASLIPACIFAVSSPTTLPTACLPSLASPDARNGLIPP